MGSHDAHNAEVGKKIVGHHSNHDKFVSFVNESYSAVCDILSSGKPVEEMRRGAELWKKKALEVIAPSFKG